MIFLDAKTDIAFKKLFGDQNGTSRTINFLNSILELQEGELITTVTIENTENLPLIKGKKKSFIDVRCTDQAKKKYIVEMQRVDEHDFLERAGYYSSVHVHNQLKKKEPFTAIAPVIFVGVVEFNLFEFSHYQSHHFFTESKTGKRTLQHSEFHFVELKKFSKTLDELSNDQDRWAYLFKHADELKQVPKQLQIFPEFLDAMTVLNEATWTEKEHMEYLAELDFERGRMSTEQWEKKQIVAAKAEGMAKGMAKGKAEGKAEGMAKGKAEGKAEGELQAKIAIAKQMLDDGMTAGQVAKFTQLPIEKIKKLK